MTENPKRLLSTKKLVERSHWITEVCLDYQHNLCENSHCECKCHD